MIKLQTLKLNTKTTNPKAYGFVGDDVFTEGEAHAGAEAERGGDGARNDAMSAHDLRSKVEHHAIAAAARPPKPPLPTKPLSLLTPYQCLGKKEIRYERGNENMKRVFFF